MDNVIQLDTFNKDTVKTTVAKNKMIYNDIFTCLEILDTISNYFNVKLSEDLIDTIKSIIFKDNDVHKGVYLFDCYKLAIDLIVRKKIPKEQFKNIANNYVGVYDSPRQFAIAELAKPKASEDEIETRFIDYETYTEHLFEDKYFDIYELGRFYVFKSPDYLSQNKIRKNLTRNDIFSFLVGTEFLLSHYRINPDALLYKLENSTHSRKLMTGFKIAIELLIKEKVINKNFSAISKNYIGKYQHLKDFVKDCFENNYFLNNEDIPPINDYMKSDGIDYELYEKFIFEYCYFSIDIFGEHYIFLQ